MFIHDGNMKMHLSSSWKDFNQSIITSSHLVCSVFQGPVSGVAQQSERTSSGLRSAGDPGHLQTRTQRDQDMSGRTDNEENSEQNFGTNYSIGFFSEDFLTSSSNPGGPGAQRAGKVTSDGFPRTARVSLAPSSSFSRCVPSLFFFFFVGRPCRFCQQHLGAPRCVCYASHSSSQKNANCGELWTKGRFDGG